MKYRFLVPGKKGEVKVKAELRVMPGNPKSKWPSQREPYILHNCRGKYLNKHGAVVPANSESAHIPLNEYNFNTLSKAISYD
ncbi:MAG: hypothetical protein KFB93_04160 [Simkaniaceae bacterium]|nr:MAG: hypothetical protein KFB93_04160 [Simkaniaceae bacterium]